MKKIIKSTLLATALAASANMQAATTVTTVEVSFPQVLVLYTWDTIQLGRNCCDSGCIPRR